MSKLTDAQVRKILTTQQRYRDMARQYQHLNISEDDLNTPTSLRLLEAAAKMVTRREVSNTETLLALYRYYTQPLMSDDEFIDELHKIFNFDIPYVNTLQAGAIYTLRAQYERLPLNRFNVPPRPNDATVRVQVSAAQRNKKNGKPPTPHALFPITKEKQQKLYGNYQPRVNMFYAVDILTHPLGQSNRVRNPTPKERKQYKRKRKVVA